MITKEAVAARVDYCPTFRDLCVDLSQSSYPDKLANKLNEFGFATFEHVDLLPQLLALGRHFGEIVPHPDADERGITTIALRETDSNKPSQLGFTDQELLLHSDGTVVETPAKFLTLYCEVPAREGGSTSLLDGRSLFLALRSERPELLDFLQAPDAAIFGNPSGEHHSGPVFSKTTDGTISIRFRADEAGHYCPSLTHVFPELLEIMDELSVKFALSEGQGYIINNRRALHARTAFTGYRELKKILLDGISPLGQQIRSGFNV